MIHCASCKTENPPEASACQKCGKDLLPGEGAGKRLSTLLVGLGPLVILPGVIAYFILTMKEPAIFCNWVGYVLIAVAVVCLAGTLVATFGKTPEHERYALRARRHVKLNSAQALFDFNKAVELAPKEGRIALRLERYPLYEKLEQYPELAEELKGLIPTIKRQIKNYKGVEKKNMKIMVRDLYTKLEEVYRKLGMERDAIRTHLAFTYYAEAHQSDLYTNELSDSAKGIVNLLGGESDAFAVGWANASKNQKSLFFEEERRKMVAAGQVKAIGYCSECKEEKDLTDKLGCPTSPKHKKIKNIRFVIPGEEADVIEADEAEGAPEKA